MSPLFLAGWKLIGGHLLVSSLYAMAVSSLAIDGISLVYVFPAMDPILAALYGGVVMGVGLGLVFSQGATTGGTDIIGKLLKLKFSWLPIGKLILVPDMVVVALVAVVFGTVDAALYGLIKTFVCSRLMDTVLYGLDTALGGVYHHRPLAGGLPGSAGDAPGRDAAPGPGGIYRRGEACTAGGLQAAGGSSR